jgi:hypothetical protein|eukprot:COSAG06_NODE_3377_length_5433_cov_2.945819_1_plen_79_part_00
MSEKLRNKGLVVVLAGVMADLVVSVLDLPHIAGFEADGGGMFSRCGSSFYITTGSASKTHDLAHITRVIEEGARLTTR